MNRRALIAGGVAAVVASVLPATPTASFEAVQWFRLLRSLSYELRKRYVANLRGCECSTHPRFAELIDLIEDMNERGCFGPTHQA